MGPLKGTYIYTTPRHGIKKILGNYEERILEAIKANVIKGDTCIDIGAHIGFMTLYMSLLAGEKGTVLAYEPIKECFDFINNSIKKNKINNTQAFNIALGNKKATGKAHVFEDSGMANFNDSGFVTYTEEQKTQTFKIDTLDSVEVKLPKVDFIKIDVEGYEANVLEGAKNVIRKHSPTFLIEVHNQDNYDRVFEILSDSKYTIRSLAGKKLTKNFKLSDITHIIAK